MPVYLTLLPDIRSLANCILESTLQWGAPIPLNLKPGPYLIRYEVNMVELARRLLLN